MHQEIAHGVKDISSDLEKKIKANIRPISADVHRFLKNWLLDVI
jgi:hypothetical protein